MLSLWLDVWLSDFKANISLPAYYLSQVTYTPPIRLSSKDQKYYNQTKSQTTWRTPSHPFSDTKTKNSKESW